MRGRCALAWLALVVACGPDELLPAVPPDAAAVDAAATPCGLPAPGTRCASARVLARCRGTTVEEVDCGEAGALCGPDPAADGAATCVAPGDACGRIDQRGACEGNVLVYCSSAHQTLAIVDCANLAATCAYVDAKVGYDCRTVCGLMDVSAEGECTDASTLVRCVFDDAGFRVEHVSCPEGTTCGRGAETGEATCAPQGPCAALGPEGRCAGTTAQRCVDGAVEALDCTAEGEVCGYGASGYACLPPGALGALAVSGTIRYEDRPPGPDGLGVITAAPARGVAVAVVADDDSRVLAFAQTDDLGGYLLRFDAPAGATVHVMAATSSTRPFRPIRVLRPDGRVHGFGSPSFSPTGTDVVDVLITQASATAPAFNVFDALVTGMDALPALTGSVVAPPPLIAEWAPEASDGTYYHDGPRGIALLGEVADDDANDDAVILHELGHYVEDVYGHGASPGGEHDGSPTAPPLAWSEGLATYLSCLVRGSDLYIDTNAGGGWSFNVDAHATLADPALPMGQPVSEDMVTEILWDASDAPVPDDDPIDTGTPRDVAAAGLDYPAGPSFDDRGAAGMDLVDWLDGWLLRRGLADCTSLREIVTTARRFPYDYSGPAGRCP